MMNDKNTASRSPLTVSPVRIFLTFLRLGVTAFGGPAMVAYIREVVVAKQRWVDDTSFRDGVALCQSIPGATAMQAAAYSGLRAGGPLGGVAAYLGFGLPAFMFMVVLSFLYREFEGISVVQSVFSGLRVIVVSIMANALWTFAGVSLKNHWDAMLGIGTAVFLLAGGPPAAAIFFTATLGLFLYRGNASKNRDAPLDGFEQKSESRVLLFSVAFLVLLACIGLLALFTLDRPLFLLGALMAKIDALAFGGGYASVPLMLHEVVEKRHWLDSTTFMDGIALGQVTPGPIVITATFVGFQTHGLTGAIVATVAVFAPSFVILLALVPYFDRLRQHLWFQRALRGAVVCFVGLLAFATVEFAVAISWNLVSVVLAGFALLTLRQRVDLIWVILGGSLLSAVLF
jgi:chromate transporter